MNVNLSESETSRIIPTESILFTLPGEQIEIQADTLHLIMSACDGSKIKACKILRAARLYTPKVNQYTAVMSLTMAARITDWYKSNQHRF